MEKIVRKDDGWYYGCTRTGTAELAYRRFREDYNKAQGKNSNGFLNQLGQRVEVVHWHGSVFSDKVPEPDSELCRRPVASRIIGIVCTSYCRIFDFPSCVPEEMVDAYTDWLMQAGNDKLKLTGRKSGLGRTNKRRNINFR